MSVVGGVALFTAGVLLGGAAVAWNMTSVRDVQKKALKERDDLRKELFETKMQSECDRAWQDGYVEGRRNPEADWETFARSFGGRKVTLRGARDTSDARTARKGA